MTNRTMLRTMAKRNGHWTLERGDGMIWRGLCVIWPLTTPEKCERKEKKKGKKEKSEGLENTQLKRKMKMKMNYI